jgi:hypothetical protein
MKLELLTNASVVDDAIKFVSNSRDSQKLKSVSGKDDQEESNEPDYDEDKDQLEEEQEEVSHRICQLVFYSYKWNSNLLTL